MANRRRRKDQEEGGHEDYLQIVAPFLDAEEGSGELPLNKLDEFIVPGGDDKGRKVTITFNIPPLLDRQLNVVLGSKRFPYVNIKDLVRHALVRHMVWLVSIRESVPQHFLAMLHANMEICRDDELTIRGEQAFRMIDERTAEYIKRGEHAEALRLINVVNQSIKNLRPTTWTRKFAARFNQRYGAWLRTNRAAIEAGRELGTPENVDTGEDLSGEGSD